MKVLKNLAFAAIGAALVSSGLAKAPDGWITDVDQAIELAKTQDKSVMVEFTGSDWCPPCIMMADKVFSKKEFFEAASKDFILVHLDFPNGDTSLRDKNEPIAEKYGVEGFPTVILLDSSGKEFDRSVASVYPEVGLFTQYLEDALEKKDMD